MNSVAFNNSVDDKVLCEWNKTKNQRTCSLREPNKNLKIFQNQRHHLVDLSDVPGEIGLEQLFLQCPSDPLAKQVPLLN